MKPWWKPGIGRPVPEKPIVFAEPPTAGDHIIPATARKTINVVPPPSLVERMEIAQDGDIPANPDARDQVIALLREHLGHLRGAVQELGSQIVLLAGEVEARRLTGPTVAEHERLKRAVEYMDAELERCRAEHVDRDEVERLKARLAAQTSARLDAELALMQERRERAK